MPTSTTVTGMVLSAMPIGEYDRRVVILTKEQGKISAFAKGARRPNSALLASTQPFSYGEFDLYMGRYSYSIKTADISNYFSKLRQDVESVYYGIYFCEFADYVTKEANNETEILKLIYVSLTVLIKKKIDIRLIRAIFELKIIALNGQAPQVFECVKCGVDSSNYQFCVNLGGLLCEKCQTKGQSTGNLSTSVIYAMQYIISKEIEKLFTFTLSEPVLDELCLIIKRHREYYIDYKFKSLDLLSII